MELEPPWSSRIAFDDQTPHNLALYCVDGRFARQTEAFLVEHLGWERCDHVAVPGSAAWFVLDHGTNHEYDAVRATMSLLGENHDIHEVALIAHQDCGFYRHHLPHATGEERVEVQLRDLRQAAITLDVWLPGDVKVHLFYANLKRNRVRFSVVER